MLKNYAILLGIGAIWGSQFIFQELALASFSPIWVGALRAVIGALTLCFICWKMQLKGQGTSWWIFAIVGLLEASIPFALVPWGQQQLASSITAILMGTIPFYVMILAPILLRNTRLSRHNIISVFVGFSGVMVLFYPELTGLNLDISVVHAAAILLAAVCFATALLLLNKIQNEHPLVIARNVLCMASVQLVFIGSFLDNIAIHDVTIPALLSVLHLGIFCAGIVYYLYMSLIHKAGALFTSFSNYLIPTIGVLLGALMNNEMIQPTTWGALLIILSALLLNQVMVRRA